MSALAQLHFLRPLWLLALPVLLLAWWWWRRRAPASAWHHHVDAHLLPHLLERRNARTGSRGLVALVALVLGVLALAGPSWRLGEQPLWRSRTPLVVAFDLSSATSASDLPPSRLLQARAKLATLLRERAGGQLGVVAFADDAYTVAPLTEDSGNIALFLDSLAPDVMPVDGQRADRAIARSVKLLRQAGFDHGDILVLTDHAESDAMREAGAAARAGFRVSVLGIGTTTGAAYRNADGAIVHARLDATSLAALADAGNGRYAAMTAGDADLRSLGVLSPAQADMAAKGESGRSWRDEGYWLLPPLMLLALFAFRRRASAAAVLLVVLLPWSPAHAQQGTLWRRADQAAHARMEAGEQAYRAGDYASAAREYAGIDGADAHYNRGNALAKQGAYAQAVAEYDRALRAQPGMADALANKHAVQAAMKRKPPQGPGAKQNQGGQGAQQQAAQSQAGGRTPPSQAQGRASAKDAKADAREEQSQAGQPGQQPRPLSRSSDAAAQRAADAAQRERMGRALRAQQAGGRAKQGNGQQRDARAESPAERERRLANEAWLRRVPDDPGGLLRAKFRLEYERRQQGGNE